MRAPPERLDRQGGLGYQFLGGGFNVGVPYFVQWKLTDDTIPTGFGLVLPGIAAAKDWSAGVGVEIDFNWNASNGVTLRWVQGVGGKNTTDGSTFLLVYNHVFPVGSKKAPGSS